MPTAPRGHVFLPTACPRKPVGMAPKSSPQTLLLGINQVPRAAVHKRPDHVPSIKVVGEPQLNHAGCHAHGSAWACLPSNRMPTETRGHGTQEFATDTLARHQS